ncbi:MAG: hypothetical protein ACI92G_002322 [Candidatus Pelagisphaera sp.]|jgi:hypothetical protein
MFCIPNWIWNSSKVTSALEETVFSVWPGRDVSPLAYPAVTSALSIFALISAGLSFRLIWSRGLGFDSAERAKRAMANMGRRIVDKRFIGTIGLRFG